MSRPISLLLTTFLFLQASYSQEFTVSGKITNSKLEPLALVSIQVKNTSFGTVSKEDGNFEIKLEEGQYDLVISMIGFKPRVINLLVTKNYTQNIILEEDQTALPEAIVKGKARDRSEEIVRNVIRHKEQLLSAAGPYSCNVYIKSIQEDSTKRKSKNKTAKVDTTGKSETAALQRMSMAEIYLRYDHETANRIKEERTAVKKRGNPESLFYQSLTEADFNLYNNLLKAPGLSEVPFLSPVSYSGLAAYKYKMVSIKQKDGHKIYTISIRPKELSNVTVQGELVILDSAWVVLSSSFTLPSFHIPEYDYFRVEQQYDLIHDTAWMISRQQFTYFSKVGKKGKVSGETIAVYKDFELNKTFPRKYFGTEVSKTTQDAYEKDSLFWQQTRTEPLTPKEIRFIAFRDSVYRATHTKAYLDSVDRVINKVTWRKVLITGQTLYNRSKQRTWNLPSVGSLFDPFQFGGARLNLGGSYNKIDSLRRSWFVFTRLSYGFRNHDINGNISVNRVYNPIKRAAFQVEVGREFEYIFQGDAWINMLKRSNMYLNNSFGLGLDRELVNGLHFYSDFKFALRRSLANYKTNDKIDSLFPNYLDNNRAIAFEPYNALYGEVTLKYTPAQQYIREPKEKIILGSKWPTFFATWRKGIPGIAKSKVNFDYVEFGLEQEIKLGTMGVSKYTIKTGGFLNRKELKLIDYQFQRRGDPLLFMNPNQAFQSLDSSFPVFKRYYQGHYVHEFNGAILNKIPFLKKLQLREIAGAGFLIAPERKLHYGEIFAGVERVFKWPFDPTYKFKFGVYIVGSAANQFRNPIQFKIGVTSWDKRNNRWF